MKQAIPRHLLINRVNLGYGAKTIVQDLSLEIPTGKITAIIGSNGCGKSTLLRGISRLLKPESGDITLDGINIHSFPSKEFARQVGLLPQAPITPDGITVADLVGRGRYPYQGLFARHSAEDDAAVAWALEATHTIELAERSVTSLSGGQRQRVWIAMALAQETDILLLDEPTTYLDLAHQVELLDLLADLNEQRGTTMVMVLHELNLAARVAHHLVAMRDGRIESQGTPAEVLTAENLHTIFGLKASVSDPVGTGATVIVPDARVPNERRTL
ncbi:MULTISPECIES: ABC transporter ATP-binding protein [unclassified Rothia (in: high G+C Gram-positive bacteria)]|uniref:ABC transporter ATP-binding protein n=1 Tax=unclassified Rothia (in: high G+C Gram-positive bacteria) TaxID=2689056 RepID=UPI0019565B9B|nr:MULTISPECIES: ABC transporter ATP-binding protein [unclassified Rothia (in: high G+C Gram-positive bacteria)]MBM7051534.1 ABC transporter ATP-binding protein [Rothia sp. ZJ1223]QRZ61313.1 ABC transporter ATP-binding protein [Rothia sp. ZJ932]